LKLFEIITYELFENFTLSNDFFNIFIYLLNFIIF